jgi:hypothetical protein
MTPRASGAATSRRRPLARVAPLAIPGGIVVGVQTGVWYSLVHTVPNFLLDPAWLDGSGSIGLAIFGAWIGAGVGAFFGLGIGAFTATVLALSWLIHLPKRVVTVFGSLAVSGAVFSITTVTFGFAPETLLLSLLGSTQGIAGVILIAWVAGLRPHDYWDVLAARERVSAAG